MPPRRIRNIKLTPELERALLAGVVVGAVPIEVVVPEELSAEARSFFQTAQDMFMNGQVPPLKPAALLLGITEVHGVPADRAKAFIESVYGAMPAGEGAEAVVRKLREKHALLTLANAAAGQFQKNEFSPDSLMEVLASVGTTSAPVSLAATLAGGMPPAPPRIPLASLPRFTERTNGGLVGVTVISGEPGIGKSTLALQAAIEAGQGMNVIYYDLDNDLPTQAERITGMVGDKPEDIQRATRRIYIRDSIRTLESDLVHLPPPGLIVVDLLQDLPTPMEYERQGLAYWMHRMKAIRRRGYFVLLVSEVNRMSYGAASLSGFKGSGEIEFAASLACQMVATRAGGAELNVVKNRHGKFRGVAATLEHAEGSFTWQEIGEGFWNTELSSQGFASSSSSGP